MVLHTVLSLVLYFGVAHAGRLAGGPINLRWDPPNWCHGHECPEFSVLQTAEDYTLREYPPSRWIQTNVTNTKLDDAFDHGSKVLEHYRDKGNMDRKQIAQTAPTFVLLKPAKKGRQLEASFSVEFYLPKEIWDNPPQAKDDRVGLLDVPKTRVWVKVFSGRAREGDVLEQVFNFRDLLKSQQHDIYEDYFGFASYDPPTTLLNRHDEVWIWGKEKPT